MSTLGYDQFTGREAQIRQDLVEAIATRDGIDLTVRKARESVADAADDLVAAWRRNPRDPSGRVILVSCRADGSMTWTWAT